MVEGSGTGGKPVEDMQTRWTKVAEKQLLGKKITAAEYVHDPEFNRPVLVILLDDGTRLYPMGDDEGNGPGALHGEREEEFFILPTL